MDSRHDLIAALDWQLELGADEAISEAPVNWFEQNTPPPAPVVQQASSTPDAPKAQPKASAADAGVSSARDLAAMCQSLPQLQSAIEGFDGCALKKGARNTVFADGNPDADLMIIGEAPGRDEDLAGKPFVGRSGQLLDRMLAAIGRDRHSPDPASAAYITNVLPWRPPQNRDPSTEEKLMLSAFLDRHIALVKPKCLLLMGNAAAKTLLDTETGITRLRGNWHEVQGIPAMPTFHPAALLRNPLQKRPVWEDLLALQSKLKGLP